MDIEGIDALKPEDSWDPTPTGPTTSPDVVITNDPGPAPEGDSPVDDDSFVEPIPVTEVPEPNITPTPEPDEAVIVGGDIEVPEETPDA